MSPLKQEVWILEKQFFTTSSVSSDRILHTPSAFAKNSLLYLQEVGTLKALSAHSSRREDLSSYLFFIVLEGKGSLSYCGQHFDLSQGDCVFINCMNPYEHMTCGDELWSLQWCHFNGIFLKDIYAKYIERGGQPVFRPSSSEAYAAVLSRLQAIAGSDDYIRDMRINENLSSLLTLLMEQSWNPDLINTGIKRRELVNVKNYLDENYSRKITLDDLESVFYINKFYLAKIFKEQYGVSINVYLSQQRITEAKKLLRFSDKSIEEISAAVGYSDANYFSRGFKKIEGITPTEYRRLW